MATRESGGCILLGIRGSVMRILLLVAVVALAKVPQTLAAELFWNDNVGIHRVQPGDSPGSLLFDTFETRGIAVNVAGGGLLWSDILPLAAPVPGGVIRSSALQGGEITDVARRLTSPAGVALDADRAKVYWTDLGDAEHASAVFSANLDGTESKQLISGEWLSEITGIAVDSRHASLYLTYVNPLLDSLYNGGIARADLDGANVEPIIDGLVKPLGIAVDGQGGSIFWAHARGLGGELDGAIEAADLNGGQRRTLLGGLEMPYGVAFDLESQFVYWTDMSAGKIQRTAASGSLLFVEDVVIGLDSPTAIAIIPEPGAATMVLLGALVVSCAGRRRTSRAGRPIWLASW